MNLSTKNMVCAVVVAFCLVGCVYDIVLVPPDSGLPEEIYATPQLLNRYRISNVGIFRFTEPPYAPGMGRTAAQDLYEELLRNEVVNVTLELDVSDMPMENLIDIARAKDYDVIITGDLLYYFEGSLHLPSRVDERMRVIHVATNVTLWYAKAVEIEPPTRSTDYFIMESPGEPAPAARALMKKNAEKFCKMLLNSPLQKFSAPAVAPAKHGGDAKRTAAAQQPRAAQKALEEQRLREERLREEAKARRERAERERFLNEHIHFELDQSRLLPEAKVILKRKAKWLTAHPRVSAIIAGHCDERGTYEGNIALGGRRARSAKSYLVDLGIAHERLTTVSYGAEMPLDAGHNENAWAKNRRAQFVIE